MVTCTHLIITFSWYSRAIDDILPIKDVVITEEDVVTTEEDVVTIEKDVVTVEEDVSDVEEYQTYKNASWGYFNSRGKWITY